MDEFCAVFVVAYMNDSWEEAILTAFDNEEAALKMYEYHRGKHDRLWIDRCRVFKQFIIKSKELEEK